MKVAVIGGTGRMGKALAKQLSRNNKVIIGSRDAARAQAVAGGISGAVGMDYVGASTEADAALFAIPYSAIGEASALKKELSGKLAVSLINPLKLEDGVLAYSLDKGSAAEELAMLLPDSRISTAFNHVSFLFFERDEVTPIDILVAADSRQTYEETAGLVKGIPNLRPLYAGPLSQARAVEEMTAMVLNLAKLNGTGSLTTKFVSTRDSARH
ncbi:MAG: NAD(P)-binding domain-containing protein [Thaumarchaeota archaeon]|nr:NAD(P)-binding domain-containing protein [Nitrososphaerota archaeon]